MKVESFVQRPPSLGNQFEDDRVLQSYLRRVMPPDVLADVTPPLQELGEMAGGELYRTQLAERCHEPQLTQWDAWGQRIDLIEISPLWQRAARLAAERGIVAAAYEGRYGRFDRIYQFALAYLFHPSTDVYSCPLAMTDGAARTLLKSGNQALIAEAVPRLTSRDPDRCWTSGQWMTESSGGSDVGLAQTVARQDPDGQWRLYGRKWFTSAAASQIALTLARPAGNPAGGKGLALFYLKTRDAQGRLKQIEIARLKDKLGTRKVPTAELLLQGAPAVPVAGLTDGVRHIVPMLQLTRTWNGISATATMRRGLALARSYAARRQAFGAPLAEKPLHVDTLAWLQAETEAAFHLTFFLVELIGKDEAGVIDEDEAHLLRLLSSLAKLTTGRQAVQVAAEVLEAHGGAGYVEDTGLPLLLRDSQVLPIWEGTTNVLALDVLRTLTASAKPLAALAGAVRQCLQPVQDERLRSAGRVAQGAVTHAGDWLKKNPTPMVLEAGARRLALTLGRALALAKVTAQAQWSLTREHDTRPRAAACRFAQTAIDRIVDFEPADGAALIGDR
jgi:acyl-CoA dehydrogenase